MEFKQILGTFKGALETSLQKKFKILSRDQLKALLEEQSVSGEAKLTAAKYILVTTVTGFSDGSASNSDLAGVAHTRTIKLLGTAQITKLNRETLSTSDFSVTDHMGKQMLAGIVLDEKFGDELVEKVPKEAANQIATSVMYYIAPPKVTDVTGKQVTINWGDGFIAKSDKLDVFALKIKENADPIEIPVSSIEINRVTPKNSYGHIEERIMELRRAAYCASRNNQLKSRFRFALKNSPKRTG